MKELCAKLSMLAGRLEKELEAETGALPMETFLGVSDSGAYVTCRTQMVLKTAQTPIRNALVQYWGDSYSCKIDEWHIACYCFYYPVQ